MSGLEKGLETTTCEGRSHAVFPVLLSCMSGKMDVSEDDFNKCISTVANLTTKVLF